MRLTLHTDYGVRVLLYLAAAPERRGTVRQISAAYGISSHHLGKVATSLADAGLVTTSAGRCGGLTLVGDPSDVSLGAVVRLLEPDFAFVECLIGEGRCAIDGCCVAKGAFERAGQAFLSELDGTSLADAAAQRRGMQVALRISERPG